MLNTEKQHVKDGSDLRLHALIKAAGGTGGGTGSPCSKVPVVGQWLVLASVSIQGWGSSVTGNRRGGGDNKSFPHCDSPRHWGERTAESSMEQV